MRPHLSIVIPHYNNYTILKKSLSAVGSSKNIHYEIIVVDNNSSDNSCLKVRQEFPHVVLISLPKNIGFTGACNAGVKKSLGELILFLNNDCIVGDDTIQSLVKILDSKDDLVAVQPVVLSTDGKIENAGFNIDIKHARAYPITNKVQAENIFLKQNEIFHHNKIIPRQKYISGLSATCLLVKKHDFIQIGMFDEKFHSYLEDVDLAIRFFYAGKQVCVLTDLVVIHHHMFTSKKMGTYKEQHDLKNWMRIIYKNYSLSEMFFFGPYLFIERLRNLSGLLKKMTK